MKKKVIIVFLNAIALFFTVTAIAQSQTSDELQRFEIGAQFSSFSINPGTRTEQGFGGRIGINLNETVALEAEGNFFPRDQRFGSLRTGGRAVQGLFGVKIGKRFQRFGIFAKARPGFISFSRGQIELIPTGTSPFPVIDVRTERLTHFATDLGGVLEFYLSRRILTRLDFGDTIIRYGATPTSFLTTTPSGALTSIPFTVPAETRHNFQFSAGIGFRF